MKITFEMDNLQDLIEKSVSGNIEEAVKSQVEDTIKEQVAKLGGDIISEVVTKNFNEFVNDYITNTKITVRKEDFWGDADVNEYTVEEYIKKCLKERLDNERLLWAALLLWEERHGIALVTNRLLGEKIIFIATH